MQKIIITFGIDCDPFCRRQENFQTAVEKILKREITTTSKCFGCWQFEEEVTPEQHEEIAKLAIHYYNIGAARGISCTDLKKYMQ